MIALSIISAWIILLLPVGMSFGSVIRQMGR